MAPASQTSLYADKPVTVLICAFVAWKTLLLFVACCSPGPGYDTSTDLLFHAINDAHAATLKSSWLSYIPRKLVRWDAIYFVSAAERGYVNEQEWAFGWGFAKVVSFVAALLPYSTSSLLDEAWAAILIANFSHLLSVLLLHYLAQLLQTSSRDTNFPFLTACLHIIAPAGIFLSAPYGESLFSALNFGGLLAYCKSRQRHSVALRTLREDLYLCAAGAFFALAATVRSNALFNGVIFAYDLVVLLPQLPQLLGGLHGLRYLVSLISAGLCVAVGFSIPQYLAYIEYCTGTAGGAEARPWCNRIPPSIYAFVQDHYWNVGILRYWTMSNLPLFALATPMLSMMLFSGCSALIAPPDPTPVGISDNQQTGRRSAISSLRRIAIPQVLLAILALTSFHVQVITRLASGYPTPYFWLASSLLQSRESKQVSQSSGLAQATVRWMVVYALVQGGLFASFLPPA